jgi:hypothetical protein
VNGCRHAVKASMPASTRRCLVCIITMIDLAGGDVKSAVPVVRVRTWRLVWGRGSERPKRKG